MTDIDIGNGPDILQRFLIDDAPQKYPPRPNAAIKPAPAGQTYYVNVFDKAALTPDLLEDIRYCSATEVGLDESQLPDPDLDLGGGMFAQFWPARNPQGIMETHPHAQDPSKRCCNTVRFSGPPDYAGQVVYERTSQDPLTLDGILTCEWCSRKGQIQAGLWVTG